jgi:hypothetical protein
MSRANITSFVLQSPTRDRKLIQRAIDNARQTHSLVILHADTVQWLLDRIGTKRESALRKER